MSIVINQDFVSPFVHNIKKELQFIILTKNFSILELNFINVKNMDSVGLGAILSLYSILKSRRKKIIINNISDCIYSQIININEFNRQIHLYPMNQ